MRGTGNLSSLYKLANSYCLLAKKITNFNCILEDNNYVLAYGKCKFVMKKYPFSQGVNRWYTLYLQVRASSCFVKVKPKRNQEAIKDSHVTKAR